MRLLVEVSGHGFGHAMQTCAVLQALAARGPHLDITLVSTVPESFFRHRLNLPFRLIARPGEVGMRMLDAVQVDVPASLAAYREFHRNWLDKVANLAREFRQADYDCVFSNVNYLPLAAAHAAGIPSVALCSLNWADIFRHYCPQETQILAEIHAAYASATIFLQPAPHMPMTDLPNRRSLPPLAQTGQKRRRALRQRLGFAENTRLVLIALGGFDLDLKLEQWPRESDLGWLIPGHWSVDRPDCRDFQQLDLPYIDIFASCDAVITKPGYGTFSEAACNGVPVLYVPREDWPEAAYLVEWLREQGRCQAIPLAKLRRGVVREDLAALWRQPEPSRPVPEGVVQAAEAIWEVASHGGKEKTPFSGGRKTLV